MALGLAIGLVNGAVNKNVVRVFAISFFLSIGLGSGSAQADSRAPVFEYLMSMARQNLWKASTLIGGDPSDKQVGQAVTQLEKLEGHLMMAGQLLRPLESLSNAPFKSSLKRPLKAPLAYGPDGELLTVFAVVEFVRMDAMTARAALKHFLDPGAPKVILPEGSAMEKMGMLELAPLMMKRASQLIGELFPKLPHPRITPYLLEARDRGFLERLEASIRCSDILPAPGANLSGDDFRKVSK